MKKMKFLFAVLAIVFAAGSAFTPAKKKLDPEKKWFKLVNATYPEDASSYELTTPLVGDEGDDIECPYTPSSTVCAIFATVVPDMYSVPRPDASELSYIVSESDHFQLNLVEENEEYILQYVVD